MVLPALSVGVFSSVWKPSLGVSLLGSSKSSHLDSEDEPPSHGWRTDTAVCGHMTVQCGHGGPWVDSLVPPLSCSEITGCLGISGSSSNENVSSTCLLSGRINDEVIAHVCACARICVCVCVQEFISV